MSSPDIDSLFQALGDPSRRAMLDALRHGPRSVSNLAAPLNITLTAVAQHLKVLERCHLVRTQKVGRVRTCAIDETGFTLLEQWSAGHRSSWSRGLDQLGDLLIEDDT